MLLYKGVRVRYTSGAHGQGEDNPMVGSRWECEGTITEMPKGTNWCEVTWDNGKVNSYYLSDLTPSILTDDLFEI
jgi:hypothetical protein